MQVITNEHNLWKVIESCIILGIYLRKEVDSCIKPTRGNRWNHAGNFLYEGVVMHDIYLTKVVESYILLS
jgi:hypothetical protein